MVGDYELVIGFQVEPAVQGEPNGLDLRVTNTKTGEPVSGLEDTLQAEIIYGASKKTLRIEPEFGQDGAYSAHVILTEAGDYTWRIFGDIEDTPVDVSMTSSPDTFSSVALKSDYSFPGQEAALQSLQSELQSARTAALVGAVLGGIGLLLGLIALVMVFTRRKGTSLQ
ncbi:MAG: hypothetical protein EHM21_06650 [Chloroflexi bacterium]|nr:MAG: hypothetical protein EHM21_06650 [Chloroflexota bacterium]